MNTTTRIMREQDTLLRTQTDAGEAITLLHIGKTSTTLISGPCAETVQRIDIPFGYLHVRSAYFMHTPPTPDDIEYAINYIEDEIERIVPRVNHASQLCTFDSDVMAIGQLATMTPAQDAALPDLDSPEELVALGQLSQIDLDRDTMEALFNRYAAISMGRPATAERFATNATFYARLLILRELMHHLKFRSLRILRA
jgi:exopolyphosphatase/pppGpp-phosphohydrolase